MVDNMDNESIKELIQMGILGFFQLSEDNNISMQLLFGEDMSDEEKEQVQKGTDILANAIINYLTRKAEQRGVITP